VPASCHFVVDVRVNEQYSFQEVIDILQSVIPPAVQLKPRSTRLRSSLISLDHPLVKIGLANQLSYYGSPTTSDKALLPFPALKLGPGNSARSHSADEWVGIDEIEKGIDLYYILIDQLTNPKLRV
jgi:acetylornithine deacetylase